MTSSQTFDVVVIGAGAAGENAADYAHREGLSAVLVEAELVGGECSYWACMPSKVLLRPVDLVSAAASLPGVTTTLDVDAVLGRRDAFTGAPDPAHVAGGEIDSSQAGWAEGAGISLVRGTGVISGEKEVTVTALDGSVTVLTATHAVVVATGSVPFQIDIPGLTEAQPWGSRELTAMKAVPARVAVLGGGVIAVEGARMLAGLGATAVTVLSKTGGLLGRHEPWVAPMVQQGLEDLGVVVKTDTFPTSMTTTGGVTTLEVSDGTTLEVDRVVLAVGRKPTTDGLGLEAFGWTDGPLTVDEHLQVPGVDWLYAVGDVNGRPALTHVGKYDARVAGAVIAARAHGKPLVDWLHTARLDAVPSVVFVNPTVATVGMTVAQAKDKGLDVQELSVPGTSAAGTAVLGDDLGGKFQLVLDKGAGVLVGATFVGADAAELLHSASVAISAKVPLTALWQVIPSYPTVSEVWLRLLDQWLTSTRS